MPKNPLPAVLLFLVCCAGAPALAQSTSGPIDVDCGAWTSLGVGPMTVTLRSGPPAWIVASAAQPADPAGIGEPLEPGPGALGVLRTVDVAQNLWARAVNCTGGPAKIVTTSGVTTTVGGKTTSVCVTPIISANTYSAGQLVGGSDADRQKLEGFLAWNAGIADQLQSTHPYRYTRP